MPRSSREGKPNGLRVSAASYPPGLTEPTPGAVLGVGAPAVRGLGRQVPAPWEPGPAGPRSGLPAPGTGSRPGQAWAVGGVPPPAPCRRGREGRVPDSSPAPWAQVGSGLAPAHLPARTPRRAPASCSSATASPPPSRAAWACGTRVHTPGVDLCRHCACLYAHHTHPRCGRVHTMGTRGVSTSAQRVRACTCAHKGAAASSVRPRPGV